MSILKRLLPAVLAIIMLAGCSKNPDDISIESLYVDGMPIEEINIEDEATALSSSPAALNDLLLPVASGTKTEKNSKAAIDYSNSKDGYVMVKFTASTEKRLKVRTEGPSSDAYQYNLTRGDWEVFPLSDGNGRYKVTVYENTTGTKYATVLSASFDVKLTDEFAPFIRPNQYVDYAPAENTLKKAEELIGNESDTLKQVEKVYDFTVKTLKYDKEKAKTVKSGYLPVLDDVLAKKSGICFDYAALMTGMLRSQGVPCKLVVGYAGTAYHAWVSVWTEETGWIDGVIYFDGNTWQRMDPTFASSGKGSEAIMKYIGDGKNYKAKYLY